MLTVGNENMQKFYQAENHNCSDFETKCLRRNDSTDEDMSIFVQAGGKEKQSSKYTKLKRKESRSQIKAENVSKYDGLSIKTKRKRRCCPIPTLAFCFCWVFLVVITFVSLLRYTTPRNIPGNTIVHLNGVGRKEKSRRSEDASKPCDDFQVKSVWTSTYKEFTTSSAVRFVDVNQDGADDVIIGFGHYSRSETYCSSINITYPCEGGALAIDGKSGKELWTYFTKHEVFAINCNDDITNDGIADCLFGGRYGVFDAVNGKTGKLLWSFDTQSIYSRWMNLYTAQFVRDFDHDGVMEILQIHGGDIQA